MSAYIEETTQSRALFTPDNALYLGGGYQNCKITRRLTSSGVEDVAGLSSSQVEGDTPMTLHAVKASERLSPTSTSAQLIIHSLQQQQQQQLMSNRMKYYIG